MGHPDLITTFSHTPQVLTAGDVVSERVNSMPSDKARQVFIHSDNMVRIIVAVAPTGMATGLRVEFRVDTAAGLASGNELVIGDSGILLPAELTIRSVHEFRIKPMALPEGYDFQGLFYNFLNESAGGGFALYADMVAGAEKLDPVTAAP